MKLTLPQMRFWLTKENKMLDMPFNEERGAEVFFVFHSPEEWDCILEEIDTSDKDSLILPEKKKVLFCSNDAVPLRSTEYFDKTLKNIVYEGDIIKIDGEEPFVVEYHENFNLTNAKIRKNEETGLEYLTNVEVLGNVYEHPNLKPVEM